MNALRGIALAGFCCLIAWPLSARAQDIQIDHYKLISSKRLSRTIYGNTYKADVRNGSDADLNIAASLSSTSTSIVVADGSLSFGDVPAGATVQSNDTFSLRVDRRKPFDLSALQWSPQTTPLPPTSFALIDQALAAGTIDADAALLFKVYVEFDDSALPAEYRGRDDGFFEARAVLAAMERFDTLSPDTQQLIAPFLREPDAPGSWYEQRAANQLGHPVAVESGAAAQASLRRTRNTSKRVADGRRRTTVDAGRGSAATVM